MQCNPVSDGITLKEECKKYILCSFILNHSLALNPFAKCYLLSGGCFPRPWELKLLSSSAALSPYRLGSCTAKKKNLPSEDFHILMPLICLRWFLYCHMLVSCTCGFCTVFGPLLSGRSLGISPEFSWGLFVPPVVVSWYPSFPGSPQSKVWAAWAMEAARPLIHWRRSRTALLCPIWSVCPYVCRWDAKKYVVTAEPVYPTCSLFPLPVVSGRQGTRNDCQD